MDSPEQIIEEAREQGYYVKRNVDLTRQEFVEWCNSLSTPWTKEIHKIHTETFDDGHIAVSYTHLTLPTNREV